MFRCFLPSNRYIRHDGLGGRGRTCTGRLQSNIAVGGVDLDGPRKQNECDAFLGAEKSNDVRGHGTGKRWTDAVTSHAVIY